MRATIDRNGERILVIATLLFLLLPGCGGGLVTKVVEGTVTVAGQSPDGGEVRFIPIEGTPGSTNASAIKNGKYRIAARGGVPLGKYRVEFVAFKKTGRKLKQSNGLETVMADEVVEISPPEYAGRQSPLTIEITPDFDGQYNIKQ